MASGLASHFAALQGATDLAPDDLRAEIATLTAQRLLVYRGDLRTYVSAAVAAATTQKQKLDEAVTRELGNDLTPEDRQAVIAHLTRALPAELARVVARRMVAEENAASGASPVEAIRTKLLTIQQLRARPRPEYLLEGIGDPPRCWTTSTGPSR